MTDRPHPAGTLTVFPDKALFVWSITVEGYTVEELWRKPYRSEAGARKAAREAAERLGIELVAGLQADKRKR